MIPRQMKRNKFFLIVSLEKSTRKEEKAIGAAGEVEKEAMAVTVDKEDETEDEARKEIKDHGISPKSNVLILIEKDIMELSA